MPEIPPLWSLASQLPTELIHQIFLELDVPSLGKVRRVNRATRDLVESFPEYNLLREHASDALRVMHITKCASFFPIRWLITELCQPQCRACGDFGPYLYLPTVTRLCFHCALFNPLYQVAPVSNVMFHYGISEKQIESLPVIHNVLDEVIQDSKFVDVYQAWELSLRIHGSPHRIEQVLEERAKATNDEHRRRWDESPRGIPAHPLHSDDALLWRHFGTTAFPYWDLKTQTLEPGAYCRACMYHWGEKLAESYMLDWPVLPLEWCSKRPLVKALYYRAFRMAELAGHFLWCPEVKKMLGLQDPVACASLQGDDDSIDDEMVKSIEQLDRSMEDSCSISQPLYQNTTSAYLSDLT